MFVLDGSVTSHVDKKENVVTAGYAVIAVPNDMGGILEAKISIGAEKVKQAIVAKLTVDSKDVINSRGSVIFATVNGKIIGLLR